MFISDLLLLNFLVGLGPGGSLLCSSLFLFDLERKMKSIMRNLGYVVVSHVKVCLLPDPSIMLMMTFMEETVLFRLCMYLFHCH